MRVNGGSRVVYQSKPGYRGEDSFSYMVSGSDSRGPGKTTIRVAVIRRAATSFLPAGLRVNPSRAAKKDLLGVPGDVGLGRMGGNITPAACVQCGHECVVFDANLDAALALGREGATSAAALQDLVKRLKAPRIIWLMLPAGAVTEKAITELAGLMAADDTIIDGGNTFWKDDIRRAAALRPRGIHYLDVGTSGGVWGLERGYCLMIGGEVGPWWTRLEGVFRALAPGAGEIPKTPHREGHDFSAGAGLPACRAQRGRALRQDDPQRHQQYGLMQAYAEGFDILKHAGDDVLPAEHRFDLNLADIAEVWRRGSAITSWLLDLTATAHRRGGRPRLGYTGNAADSGEGRWTLMAAIDEAVPAEWVLSVALYTRFRSRQSHTFAEKILSAMRKGFGGHQEPK